MPLRPAPPGARLAGLRPAAAAGAAADPPEAAEPAYSRAPSSRSTTATRSRSRPAGAGSASASRRSTPPSRASPGAGARGRRSRGWPSAARARLAVVDRDAYGRAVGDLFVGERVRERGARARGPRVGATRATCAASAWWPPRTRRGASAGASGGSRPPSACRPGSGAGPTRNAVARRRRPILSAGSKPAQTCASFRMQRGD